MIKFYYNLRGWQNLSLNKSLRKNKIIFIFSLFWHYTLLLESNTVLQRLRYHRRETILSWGVKISQDLYKFRQLAAQQNARLGASVHLQVDQYVVTVVPWRYLNHASSLLPHLTLLTPYGRFVHRLSFSYKHDLICSVVRCCNKKFYSLNRNKSLFFHDTWIFSVRLHSVCHQANMTGCACTFPTQRGRVASVTLLTLVSLTGDMVTTVVRSVAERNFM